MSGNTPAPSEVQRYRFQVSEPIGTYLEPEGVWMRFEDHAVRVAALEAERDALKAEVEKLKRWVIDYGNQRIVASEVITKLEAERNGAKG